MINVQGRDENCCGCYSCFNSCHTKAITMIRDDEGFVYPSIDESLCVHCNECSRVCPEINKNEQTGFVGMSYAARCNDETLRSKSSSGGVFGLLAKTIIDSGGVVFGAAFDKNYSVIHCCTTLEEDIDKLRGSKYLQSHIGSTFLEVKRFLEQSIPVLFTGTPCQIEGLLFFLKKSYENLFTQDIVCHGVPSEKVWKEFLKWKGIDRIKDLSFRDKNGGWKNYSLRLNGKMESHRDNLFMKAFANDLCLRPSCYTCKFKKENGVSDITLGDLWGSEYLAPELDDDRGLSLIKINTKKGLGLFSRINNQLIYKSISFKDATKYNPSLIIANEKPKKRDFYMREVGIKDFSLITTKCCRKPFLKRLFRRIKRILTSSR